MELLAVAVSVGIQDLSPGYDIRRRSRRKQLNLVRVSEVIKLIWMEEESNIGSRGPIEAKTPPTVRDHPHLRPRHSRELTAQAGELVEAAASVLGRCPFRAVGLVLMAALTTHFLSSTTSQTGQSITRVMIRHHHHHLN